MGNPKLTSGASFHQGGHFRHPAAHHMVTMSNQKSAGDVSTQLLRIWLSDLNEKSASAVFPGQLCKRTIGKRANASANTLAL
eukprot:9364658-Pyramimonas_sp.AAC.1